MVSGGGHGAKFIAVDHTPLNVGYIDQGSDFLDVLAMQVGQQPRQVEIYVALPGLGFKRVLIGHREVAQALNGAHASMVRVNDRGEVIVSVAVPVQRFRAVRGALMLSTQGADIDDMVEAERLAIVKVFLVAAGVMVVLSMLLAGTIAGPVRRLADGAEGFAAVSAVASRFPILPDGGTRSENCQARCAT